VTAQPSSWAALLSGGRLPLFALLCLGVWLNAADAMVTSTIMPSVAADVGGYRYFAWATAGLLMGGIVAGASAGALSERLGLRGALLLGALTYATGCAASALAPGIFPFLAGRVIQGVGGGWVVGLVFVAIGVLFEEPLWPMIFASLSALWGVATVLGPLIGGVFAGAGQWRWTFWGFAGQGLLLAVATAVLLPREASPTHRRAAPWPQLVLVIAGVGCTAAADIAPSPAMALVLVLVGLSLLAAMLRVDSRSSRRLLPARAADLRSAAGAGYAMQFAVNAAAVTWTVYGAAILQSVYRLSPLAAGYVVAAEAVGWSAVAMFNARVPEAQRPARIRLGAALIPLALASLAVTLGRGPLAFVISEAVLLGAGFGLSFAFVNARVVGSLEEGERAVGSSAVPTVQMTGNAVGAALAGAVANLLGLSHGFNPQTARAAAPVLFGLFVPLAAAGWLAARRLAPTQLRPMA